MKPLTTAIIPAYNEENSIFDIVRIARIHPLIKEVIVVADGCTDATAARARDAGASKVIESAQNQGKGQAMNIGVKAATGDVLVFLDADILGLTPELLTRLIEPVIHNEQDMTTLWRGHFSLTYYTLPSLLDLSGERCLKRSFWNRVPHTYKEGFKIEIALNYFAQKEGLRTQSILARELSAYSKEYKRGLTQGIYEHGSELSECVRALYSLYTNKENAHELLG